MSDHPTTPVHWQAPALALARWTAMLMGWVWLGQQGQRLGWAAASGLLAVALWWGMRLLVERLGTPSVFVTRQGSLALGMVTAAGATGVAQARPGPLALAGLLALAVVWALWVNTLDRQSQHTARCRRPWAGWPPILGAAAVWLSLRDPGLIGGGVLLGTAVLAWTAAPLAPPHAACWRHTGLAQSIPSTAMGWMMGSLWLGNAWCLGTGWSSESVVGLHLMLMAALPACIQMNWLPRQLPETVDRLLPLLWVALGSALLWAAPLPSNGWLSMVFFALAWALPHRPRAASNPGVHRPLWCWAPLLAPLALVAVGHWSPVMGPQALTRAFTALGLIASTALVLDLCSPWILHRPASLRRP